MSQQVCMRRLGTLACVDDNLYAFLRQGFKPTGTATDCPCFSFMFLCEVPRKGFRHS